MSSLGKMLYQMAALAWYCGTIAIHFFFTSNSFTATKGVVVLERKLNDIYQRIKICPRSIYPTIHYLFYANSVTSRDCHMIVNELIWLKFSDFCRYTILDGTRSDSEFRRIQ